MTRSGGFTYKHGQLAPRERECALLIAQGLNNQEIAERMGIGEKAVWDYVRAAYRHYGVDGSLHTNRAKLALAIADDARVMGE
jgi:DNA-binding CsgD family transcriptional regulator